MKLIDWSSLDAAGKTSALARPAQRTAGDVTEVVRTILNDVRERGGAAVTDWCVKLDKAPPRRIAITPEVVAEARNALPPGDVRALRMAAENVRVFHQATKPEDTPFVETTPGVRSKLAWRPIASAGLYIPGGTAPLFSSLLMLAIPAGVAGVGQRVAVTPPSKDGGVHPAMILAAAEAELDAIWLMGGAQAIAALTFGVALEDGIIPACDKLFGPGNAYVAEAKKQASALPGGPAVDMPAGPSELMVIVDRDAAPEIAAADLLSQAEHDADAQVILVSTSRATIDYILSRGGGSGRNPAARSHRPRLAERGPRHPGPRPRRRLRKWPTCMAPNTWRSRSTIPNPWSIRSRPPAPSSSAGSPPRLWAITPPAPATSCPPTAAPALWAASPRPAS
jgi:histidinol dehydrogenase